MFGVLAFDCFVCRTAADPGRAPAASNASSPPIPVAFPSSMLHVAARLPSDSVWVIGLGSTSYLVACPCHP
jgi:hypothetical protein